MEAQGVRSVWRSRREDGGERTPSVPARVDSEHVAPSPMKPCDDEDVVPDGDASKSFRCPRLHVQPGIGGSLRALLGLMAPSLELGANEPDGSQPKARRGIISHPLERAGRDSYSSPSVEARASVYAKARPTNS